MNAIPLTENRPSSKGRQKIAWQDCIAWLPLAILPAITLPFRSNLAPWVFMWLLAVAVFAGCKWQTWWEVRAQLQPGWKRSAGYLLLWPGMDAREFLARGIEIPGVAPREWFSALLKTIAGAVLFWSAARFLSLAHPLLAGWLGMLGIVLVLHFGLFDLVSCAWRAAGVLATPIMRQPVKSQSLGEFWGKRWNLGFRKLSHSLVFRPLKNRFGAAIATLCAFLASGLIHDFVISVPARAGYGMPTAYFLIQGCGVLAERSTAGEKLGLGRGARGWLWMAFVTAAPLFILFHPWFVLRVIVPFEHAAMR